MTCPSRVEYRGICPSPVERSMSVYKNDFDDGNVVVNNEFLSFQLF